jgi:hypothetical protein
MRSLAAKVGAINDPFLVLTSAAMQPSTTLVLARLTPAGLLEYGNVTRIRDTESISESSSIVYCLVYCSHLQLPTMHWPYTLGINRVDIWSESLAGLPTNHYLRPESSSATENLQNISSGILY